VWLNAGGDLAAKPARTNSPVGTTSTYFHVVLFFERNLIRTTWKSSLPPTIYHAPHFGRRHSVLASHHETLL
jgi:hypothetical protein